MQSFVDSIGLSAAGWSAVAASFAALLSFLILRTQRLSLRESSRPEIILTGWSREPGLGAVTKSERLLFTAIKNIGRGTALHVNVNAFSLTEDQRPTYTMSSIRRAAVAPNTELEVGEEILIFWNNVSGASGAKSVPIRIEILCWDTIGIRYETIYNLLVVESTETMHVGDPIAPGVMLGTRSTKAIPLWQLKFGHKVRSIPLLNKVFPRD